MTYTDSLGMSLSTLEQIRQQGAELYRPGGFKLTREYIPIAVAFAGVVGVALTYKYIRKRKKKRGGKK